MNKIYDNCKINTHRLLLHLPYYVLSDLKAL